MTPIPDVVNMNPPNIFLFTSREEFIQQVINLMEHSENYTLNLDSFSWKRKAHSFELLFDELMHSSSSESIKH
jgi:hypothetical protein